MQPPPPAGGPPGPPPAQSNGLGLTAMILGIVSIPTACCWLGIPLGIVAAVLGFMGKNKADQGLASNRGQAMAGLITGIVGAGIGILLLLLSVVFNVVDYQVPTN